MPTEPAHGVSGDGALAGLRVVDTATLYAAPFISTLLADQGADVVKIEPPGGDDYRYTPARMWPLLARSKKSVVADLRDPDGAAFVRALAAEADVLVVNMPLGLAPDRPRLRDDGRAQPRADLRPRHRVRPGRPVRRPTRQRHARRSAGRADAHDRRRRRATHARVGAARRRDDRLRRRIRRARRVLPPA